jgi:hypothetical protein
VTGSGERSEDIYRRKSTLRLLLGAGCLLLGLSLTGRANPITDTDGDADGAPLIVERYLNAIQAENSRPQDVSMEVDIDAKLPRLNKEGRLHAFKFISRLGQIVYRAVRFEGDDTVKKDVIARYLTAEKEAQTALRGSLAITPQNYKFKYKGTADWAGQTAYVFQVTPREKRQGLYKGELWVDSATYLPLREWGELVKNPSVFLKKVYFVRDYFIYEGRSIPRRIISDVDTRLVGRAELTIWFNNISLGEPLQAFHVSNGDAQPSQGDLLLTR